MNNQEHKLATAIATAINVLIATIEETLANIKMELTKTPTEEGWYWYRHTPQHSWVMWEVFRDDNGHWWASPERQVVDNWYDLENHKDEWVGPIPEPIDG